jgi:hypothetical protein
MPETSDADNKENFSYLKNVDSFLLKKWDHAFNVFFDMNKDGVLEWEDFEILVSVGDE